MTKKYPKVGAILDRNDYTWLLEENEDLAHAIEAEVQNGADPDAIGRYVAQCIGDHRVGTIRRCIGAARHISSTQAERG